LSANRRSVAHHATQDDGGQITVVGNTIEAATSQETVQAPFER
jgi:hypothetical protein